MKTILYIILAAILLFALFFFSKPDDQTCINSMQEKMKESFPKNMLAEIAIRKGLRVDDKILYKEITYSFDGSTRTVGYGYLGMVSYNK